MRQLASSMAVGLAIFLSAMLLPVFLVALWTKESSHQSDSKPSQPGEHQVGENNQRGSSIEGGRGLNSWPGILQDASHHHLYRNC